MHDAQIGKIGNPRDSLEHKESGKVALGARDRIQKANDVVDSINDGLPQVRKESTASLKKQNCEHIHIYMHCMQK